MPRLCLSVLVVSLFVLGDIGDEWEGGVRQGGIGITTFAYGTAGSKMKYYENNVRKGHGQSRCLSFWDLFAVIVL